ncbi:hypothetical protein JXQ70_13670 [bacterium]|nr:hypothetical protein [bacterium]
MTEKQNKKQFVRIWVELDMNDVKEHLIISDESLGSCAVCREVGIDIQTAKVCPSCKTEFRYVTAKPRGFQKEVDPKILARIRVKCPHLTIVDWADYDHGQGKTSAREFLKL